MKIIITILLLTLTITGYADSILKGHIPKGFPLVAYAQSDKPNPVYLVPNVRVIIDEDLLHNSDIKTLSVKLFLMGNTYDDNRNFYEYLITFYKVDFNPLLDSYTKFICSFDDTNSGQFALDPGNKYFEVSHEKRIFKKGEQFTITPLRDIPVTIDLTDSATK